MVTYEEKMRLPDGAMYMDQYTDDELLHHIAKGLEPALPSIMKTLPESV